MAALEASVKAAKAAREKGEKPVSVAEAKEKRAARSTKADDEAKKPAARRRPAAGERGTGGGRVGQSRPPAQERLKPRCP